MRYIFVAEIVIDENTEKDAWNNLIELIQEAESPQDLFELKSETLDEQNRTDEDRTI